ncbi:ATP-binding protein [Methylomonas sp. AM2-LC]|uniref:AlbA family DNA-binding domain-containing protein n=1 Tax=Methylomonas sp. AM2-LC TaxID=3153301 RepID=UPI003263ABE9
MEFKRDDIRPEQLAREVVAMANFQGGKLFLGIEDDGSIISVILKAQLNLRNGIELSRSW